jgi:hypothetical protein
VDAISANNSTQQLQREAEAQAESEIMKLLYMYELLFRLTYKIGACQCKQLNITLEK